MTDDHRTAPGTATTPGDKPQGGQKDTDDLSAIKGIQDTGMARKGQDVQELPGDVTGEMDGSQPQNRRR